MMVSEEEQSKALVPVRRRRLLQFREFNSQNTRPAAGLGLGTSAFLVHGKNAS